MTSVAVLIRKVEKLENELTPKPEDTILIRMWTRDDSPLHKMTDQEIIQKAHEENRRTIILPLCKEELPT